MGIKERHQREKENLRQTILAAAHEMLVQEGYENISMRKLADKIEYSPTTIYLYFKDKRDLVDALMTEFFTRLKVAHAAVYNEKDDPLTRLKKDIRAYITCALANPNYYRLAFMITPSFRKEDYLKPGTPGTDLYLGLRTLVEQCIRKRLFRPVDVDLATQIIWTMNHGITSLLISNPNFPWVNQEKLITEDIARTLAAFTP
jgi:AcrR family transcriptional regulator